MTTIFAERPCDNAPDGCRDTYRYAPGCVVGLCPTCTAQAEAEDLNLDPRDPYSWIDPDYAHDRAASD